MLLVAVGVAGPSFVQASAQRSKKTTGTARGGAGRWLVRDASPVQAARL